MKKPVTANRLCSNKEETLRFRLLKSPKAIQSCCVAFHKEGPGYAAFQMRTKGVPGPDNTPPNVPQSPRAMGETRPAGRHSLRRLRKKQLPCDSPGNRPPPTTPTVDSQPTPTASRFSKQLKTGLNIRPVPTTLLLVPDHKGAPGNDLADTEVKTGT